MAGRRACSWSQVTCGSAVSVVSRAKTWRWWRRLGPGACAGHVGLAAAAEVMAVSCAGMQGAHARGEGGHPGRDVVGGPVQDGVVVPHPVGVLHDQNQGRAPAGPALQVRPGKTLPRYWVFSKGMSPPGWKAGLKTSSGALLLAGTIGRTR